MVAAETCWSFVLIFLVVIVLVSVPVLIDVVATVFPDKWVLSVTVCVSTRSDVAATAFFRFDDTEGTAMLTIGVDEMIKSPATSGQEIF